MSSSLDPPVDIFERKEWRILLEPPSIQWLDLCQN